MALLSIACPRNGALMIALVWAFTAACGRAPAGGSAVRSEISHVGDTTVVMNHGEPAHVRRDSVQVIWQSSELQFPHTLLLLDGRLIVADEKRIHILTQDGEFLRTVGREGHGPKEFEYVASLARFGADTLAVHDAENQRLSLFTPDGDVLGSVPYRPLLPYGNPVNGYLPSVWVRRGLVRVRGEVVSLWRERIPWTRPTRAALIWHDLEADTASALESWEGEQWFRAGGRYAATTELFPPLVIAALAPDGRFAVGNGVEYCIQTHVVMDGSVRKICRDRVPAPVGAGIRHPDLSFLKDPSLRESFTTIVGEQKIGQRLPYFDRLLFDVEDRLWVRTVGPEFSEFHSRLAYGPELRPAYRTWDVFDEAGRLLTTIEIPSSFDPQDIESDRMYGFVELPTGEIAVGVLAVPPG